MKGGSVSFEATDVQSAGRNADGISAVFGPHLLMTGLWVFAVVTGIAWGAVLLAERRAHRIINPMEAPSRFSR